MNQYLFWAIIAHIDEVASAITLSKPTLHVTDVFGFSFSISIRRSPISKLIHVSLSDAEPWNINFDRAFM